MYRKKLMQACLAGALVATIGTSDALSQSKAAAETQAIDVAESNVEDSEVEEETEEVEETSEEETEEVEETSEEETEEAEETSEEETEEVEETSEEETEEVAEETVETLSEEETGDAETYSDTVIMKVLFLCNGENVGGGDYFLPAGNQNYSILEQYVPAGYKMTPSGDFWVGAGTTLTVNVEKISTDVRMNIRFVDENGNFISGGDFLLPEGVQNYSILSDKVPAGYEMTASGDFMVVEGGTENVTVKKISKDVRMNIRFVDENGNFISGGDFFLPEGVQNYSILADKVPAGYEMTASGDFMVAEGGTENVTVKKISNEVIMNIRFVDENGNFIGGGDQFLPEGVQNRSILEQFVPAGYEMTETGDFMVTEGGKLDVTVKKISSNVIMNIRFVDENGEFISGGDYTLPEGVQNRSILGEFVPEGYEMTESGDFMVTEGGKLDVTVKKVVTDVIMNVRFVDENGEFIAGGDYTLPEGVQNRSILEQYVPAGYEMTETGDFMVEEGGKLDVTVKKVATDVIMNICFVDADGNVIAGGDYFLPEGVQNYSVLEKYLPENYKLAVSGDFMVTEGGKETVRVEKIADEQTEIIMNIQFKDGDEVVAGGDYFVPEGVQNYAVLQKYVPAGYQMTVSGDFMAEEGGKLVVSVEKVQKDVIMNVIFTYDGETVVGGDYFLPEGVQNYSILSQYVPEGYEMRVSGDFFVEEGGKLEVPLEKVQKDVIMNVIFTYDGETVVGGDFFLPEGVQNYSILEQYVPEGYEMRVSGDFFVEEGGKLEVPLEKVQKDVIMNVRFMYNDEFVAGGDFFLPEGVQNYSILEQYVPDGYKMRVSGDFFVEEGGKLEVPLEKIDNTIIMNIAFICDGEVIAGGDYFVPEGIQNYQVLQQYVPEGYEMTVSGDFFAIEGTHLDVNIQKIGEESTETKLTITFETLEGTVVGTTVLTPAEEGEHGELCTFVVGEDFQLPEGYQLAEGVVQDTEIQIPYGSVGGHTVLVEAIEADQPEDPDQPDDPDQPTDPSQPVDPSQPTDPGQTVNPGQSGNQGQTNTGNNTNTVQKTETTNTVSSTQTTEKKAPKTADTTNTAAPVAGLLGSMAVIGALLRKKVRR